MWGPGVDSGVHRYRDAAAFVTISLLWGLAFPAIEVALSAIPPLLLAAIRFDISGPLLVGYAAVASADWQPASRADLVAIASGGTLFIAVGNGVWIIGQQLTTSALSGLMTSLVPLLTAALAWVLLPRDRLPLRGVAGLGVGFVGALLILVPDGATVFAPGVVGKVYIFGGAMGVALGSVLVRRAEPTMSSPAMTGWSMVVGAVLLHAASPVAGESVGTLALTGPVLAAMLYLGVVSSAVAYGVYFDLLARRSAIELSLVMYVVPVVAAAGGWLLFGERVAPSTVAGFLVVVVGFGLMKREALGAELARVRRAG